MDQVRLESKPKTDTEILPEQDAETERGFMAATQESTKGGLLGVPLSGMLLCLCANLDSALNLSFPDQTAIPLRSLRVTI